MNEESIPILLLRLEGVLQGWGERSRWTNRDSAAMPSKSGIVGILACALGLPRESPEIVELSKLISTSTRADRPGVLVQDFQTITGLIGTADGGQRGNKGEDSTLISVRQYLQDASFLVAIVGPELELVRCENALKSPRWSLYLGRKSCVPTHPILIGISRKYTSVQAAMAGEPLSRRASGRIMFETDDNIGFLRSDELVDSKSRQFRYRRVSLKTAIEEA